MLGYARLERYVILTMRIDDPDNTHADAEAGGDGFGELHLCQTFREKIWKGRLS